MKRRPPNFFYFVFYVISGLFCIANLSQAQQLNNGRRTWNADSLGTHRAVIKVTDSSTDAVHAHIVWRRRDNNPANKEIIVVDAQTGKVLKNVYRANINSIFGDVVFDPVSGSGTYYMYYMPYKMKGRNYPQITYKKPELKADPAWLDEHGLDDSKNVDFSPLKAARVDAIQAVDSLNSFEPMEVIASDEEVEKMKKKHHGQPYLLFPEDRFHPIRMWDKLPYRWIKKGPGTLFKGVADRGEFYSFQVGLFATDKDMKNIRVGFCDLNQADGYKKIPAGIF